jgi:hypothetical protein
MAQATLVVRRDSDEDIKIRNLEVHLDGKWCADVSYGETFETPIEPGEHEVMVTNKLKKQRAEFVAREGETVVFLGTNVLAKGASALLGGLGMIVYNATLKRLQ